MGRCSMCGDQMLSAEGCVEHKILLSDGSVINSPRHNPVGSLDNSEPDDRCHDCGAQPDGVHHPHCDWAQTPDGRQVLMESMVHWKPERDTDPRSAESDYVFILILEPNEEKDYSRERKPTIAFSTLENADAWREREDWGTFSLKAMKVEDELPPEH